MYIYIGRERERQRERERDPEQRRVHRGQAVARIMPPPLFPRTCPSGGCQTRRPCPKRSRRCPSAAKISQSEPDKPVRARKFKPVKARYASQSPGGGRRTRTPGPRRSRRSIRCRRTSKPVREEICQSKTVGTNELVTARFWTWLAGTSVEKLLVVRFYHQPSQ